jgi:hypothetical protein
MKIDNDYLSEVRNQYEELPYPPRNPKEEQNRLMVMPLTVMGQSAISAI